jgi:hypothetical protein
MTARPLHLLTATGARPEAFALCGAWMRRQTIEAPVVWVIVDDGPQPSAAPEGLPPSWRVKLIRPRALWRPGQNTQLTNMRRGLEEIPGDARLAIIEDDEHYAPGWLERVARELELSEQVGQQLSRKYNIATRRARELVHPWRASLCATAVRGGALQRLRRIVHAGTRIIDGVLWRPGIGRLFDGAYVTGMKSLPGRGGIDSGHAAAFGDIHDPDLQLLRKWLGSDATEYEVIMQSISSPEALSESRAAEIRVYGQQYRRTNYRMGPRRAADVQQLLRQLASSFGRGGSLLDVGTGRGETLMYAKAAGFGEISGTEVVPYLLGERVVYAEAHALPFPDASFDHVTCFDVLEHLTPADVAPALRELRRVARLSVTASASERSDIRDGRELHISRRSVGAWLEDVRAAWGPDAQVAGSAGASPAFQLRIARPAA